MLRLTTIQWGTVCWISNLGSNVSWDRITTDLDDVHFTGVNGVAETSTDQMVLLCVRDMEIGVKVAST